MSSGFKKKKNEKKIIVMYYSRESYHSRRLLASKICTTAGKVPTKSSLIFERVGRFFLKPKRRKHSRTLNDGVLDNLPEPHIIDLNTLFPT